MNNKLFICIVKKRHTYSIMDILGGEYTDESLPKIVNTMSAREQTLLGDFDAMWLDVWGSTAIASDMYNRGKARYADMRPDLIKITGSMETIYEIPKGRPNLREAPIICAMREHTEETGISAANYELIEPLSHLRYYFSDMGKLYKYIYFIAYAQTCHTSTISNGEIDHVRWATIADLARLYSTGQFPAYKWVRGVIRRVMKSNVLQCVQMCPTSC
jgi:8-oxo-dGTP pyrophosphatase MutT (NUDIX family)